MGLLSTTERYFYGLTRLLSILLTIALLGCALVMGSSWFDLTAPAPKLADVEAPKIATDDIVKAVVSGDEAGAANNVKNPAYDRIKKAIEAFGAKYQVSPDELPIDDLVEAVQTSADSQDTTALSGAYVSGVANVFEQALQDDRVGTVIRKAEADQKPSSTEEKRSVDNGAIVQLVTDLNSNYSEKFDAQVAKTRWPTKDSADKREQGQLRLARIGGPLLLLLLVLQMLAVGRVDQSLRTLADKG
ncbi:hypothetical protein [Dyella amyloliquefaciens]|uniref:hypothetical protein n=1 Tax=Dyella amyloliquefaciens TaxID=1770545 RepID=UPI00102E6C36|nr:hypothetical protein [Dyella amyloliquefaciens]